MPFPSILSDRGAGRVGRNPVSQSNRGKAIRGCREHARRVCVCARGPHDFRGSALRRSACASCGSSDGRRTTTIVETGRSGAFSSRFTMVRRGCETLNSIDRFLFGFIALEVYPAGGDSDVPKHVRNLIQSRVYPTIDPGTVKERIGIGPIAGLRGRIVHDGISSIPEGERDGFDQRLRQLSALVRTCLRILTGAEPGSHLDPWVIGET